MKSILNYILFTTIILGCGNINNKDGESSNLSESNKILTAKANISENSFATILNLVRENDFNKAGYALLEPVTDQYGYEKWLATTPTFIFDQRTVIELKKYRTVTDFWSSKYGSVVVSQATKCYENSSTLCYISHDGESTQIGQVETNITPQSDIVDKNFYIIATGIASNENEASEKVNKLKSEGYASDYLWIPDYKSLSGAKYYSVYIGPFSTIDECAFAVEEYRKSNPSAYGLLVSNESSKRVEIRGPNKISTK